MVSTTTNNILIYCIFSFVYFQNFCIVVSWSPDAGLTPSMLDSEATITASSSQSTAGNIIDGDTSTFWQSDAFFPTGHVIRQDANGLLWACNTTSQCTSSCDSCVLGNAVDGSFLTSAGISLDDVSGEAWAQFELRTGTTTLYGVGCRINTASVTEPVVISLVTQSGQNVKAGELNSTRNYQYVSFILTEEAASLNVVAIKVASTASFTLTEVTAILEAPFETVTVSLATTKTLGWIYTRHYTGSSALNATLMTSTNGNSWNFITYLNPSAVGEVPNRLPAPMSVRYIRITVEMAVKNWAKAMIWEITPYGADGIYGPVPTATEQEKTMKELLGVNGIWGWGTKAYSNVSNPCVGPSLYTPCSSHGRNYHNWNWDVTDPDDTPDYEAMAEGEGTEAQLWLNWDTEYSAWVASGLEVEASIQFSWDESVFSDPEQDGYNYGFAFASHFGPSSTNLVKTLEVGNEPWDYPAEFYTQILLGMASGAKVGDSELFVVPCALQANSAETTNATSGSYVGARVPQEAAQYLDGLNIHAYSYVVNINGVRVGTYPENPASSMQSVRAMIRWRDANMPGKPVYLTEWGWDAATTGISCTASECVSELAGGIYPTRAALMFARYGIKRLSWFFYADGDCTTLYCRSGLSESSSLGFLPKSTLRGLSALVYLIGDSKFSSVVQEDDELWAFVLEDGSNSYLVAWRPVDVSDTTSTTVRFSYAGNPVESWLLNGCLEDGYSATTVPEFDEVTQEWTVSISGTPTIISFEPLEPTSSVAAFTLASTTLMAILLSLSLL